MKNNFKRLDVIMYQTEGFDSRNKVINLIKNNLVYVNNILINKPSKLIDPNSNIFVKNFENENHISRGYYKLKKSFQEFNINIKNKICVDIGSSTGGFAECLLEFEASKIYCIDAGYNQLHAKIKKNKKIINLEKTNFINFDRNKINENINFISIDVSFISIKKIIEKIIDLDWNNYFLVALFKPQFEIGKKIIDKSKGFVDQKYHKKLIDDFINFLDTKKFDQIKYIESPIAGAKLKNIEYLFYMEKR